MALGVVPVASALSIDEGHFFWVVLTTLILATGLWLWHAFVVWTLGRLIGTVSATALVLAHVVAWLSLWNPGCVVVEFLRFGQCSGMAGLWIIAMTYAWWGAGAGIDQWRKRTMSANARRIIFGIGLLPFVAGLWLVLAIALADLVFDEEDWRSITIAHLVTSALCVIAWTLIWRKSVPRRAPVVWFSVGLALAYITLSTVAAPLIEIEESNALFILWIAGPLMLTGVWFAVTATLWSRGRAGTFVGQIDVNTALRCPACGYSLIGLSEARCPECGRKQTLDELFTELIALQPDV